MLQFLMISDDCLYFFNHCSGRSVKACETEASPRYKETAAGEAMLIFLLSSFGVFSLIFYIYICSLLY